MTKQEAIYTAELVFTGATPLVGGGIGGGWLLLGAEREMYFKTGPTATVGAVYRWTFANAELTSAFASPKSSRGPQYLRQLTKDDEPRIPEWEATHYATKLRQRMASKVRREQVSDLREALAPYREAYKKLIGAEARTAYLMTITQAITG